MVLKLVIMPEDTVVIRFGAAFVEQGDCRGEDVVNMQAFYQYTYEGTYNLTTATMSIIG